MKQYQILFCIVFSACSPAIPPGEIKREKNLPPMCSVWFNTKKLKYAFAIDLSLSPPSFGQGSAETIAEVGKIFAATFGDSGELLIVPQYEGTRTAEARSLSESEISDLIRDNPRWKIFKQNSGKAITGKF